jgi:hypothetical protein
MSRSADMGRSVDVGCRPYAATEESYPPWFPYERLTVGTHEEFLAGGVAAVGNDNFRGKGIF